jgi:hypothetical protein
LAEKDENPNGEVVVNSLLSANNNLPPPSGSAGRSVVEGFADDQGDMLPPRDLPHGLVDRKDLARLFSKSTATIKRWERNGWIVARRRPSGRIQGYDAVVVASIAARLFRRFHSASFDVREAEHLGLRPMLDWVFDSVRTARQRSEGATCTVPILDLLALSALAETTSAIPDSLGVSNQQLAAHLPEAHRQLLLRIEHPGALRALAKGWQEAGLIAAVASSHPKPNASSGHPQQAA